MATEYPPLSKIHVVGYSANDKDYAILNQLLDPRVAGYKVPEDFSACPDKRYPNHIFTGAQPISGDQRVRHTWEILPSPWVPFTRYDDDLGPVQGRRRSVKNEGQQASLTSSTKISYEGREGSSLVLIESEESWDAGSGDPEDEESPFPIKERDFYDDRLGAVSETRQLFAATGKEQASLVYIAPKIIQTDYEVYNEYLVVKIVRSYSVPCPERIRDVYDATLGPVQEISQVVLDTKNLEGSVLFNQTAGADIGIGTIVETIYQPINTLAIEKTVRTYSVPAPERSETVYDPVKGAIFRVSRVIKNDGSGSGLYISNGVATETKRQAINEIAVDLTVDTYSLGSTPNLSGQQYEESLDIVFPYEQRAVNANSISFPASRQEIQPADAAHSIRRQYNFTKIEQQLDNFYWECPDLASVNLPNILLRATLFLQIGAGGSNGNGSGDTYYYRRQGNQSISGDLVYDIQQGYQGLVPAIRSVFFIKKNKSDITQNILLKLAKNGLIANVYPYVKTIEHTISMTGSSVSSEESKSVSISYDGDPSGSYSQGYTFSFNTQSTKIPPTLHGNIPISVKTNSSTAEITSGNFKGLEFSLSVSTPDGITSYIYPKTENIIIPSTDPPSFPIGKYITSINATPYKFGYTRVETTVIDITEISTELAKDVSKTPAATWDGDFYERKAAIRIPDNLHFTATVNTPFEKTITGLWVTGIDVIISNLGSWLSFDEDKRLLYGTPTQAGEYFVTAQVFNDYGVKNVNIKITVETP